MTQEGGDRGKERNCQERLRQAEKIHFEEVCSGNSCSSVDGEGKKMINAMEEHDL